MTSFFAALRFLTILPVPGGWCGGEEALKRSVPFFAVVGLCIGGLAAGVDAAFLRILPPLPAAVLVVLFLMAASGGLHVDGLADTADGFFSSRGRERMLEIMRDSRTGPMGTAAVACVLVLKVAALASVPPTRMLGAALLMPVAGRFGIAVVMAALPYARTDGGLCAVFLRGRTSGQAVWALAIFSFVAWWASGWMGLGTVAVSAVAALLFANYCRHKIGGFTGDTLGAVCEIVEVIPALAAAARIA